MNNCIALGSTLTDAKKFLKDNSTETTRGGQNKILEPHQEKAIHDFIRSLLLHDLRPTHDLVFNAIVSLKRLQNPKYSDPTKRSYRRGEIAE